MTEGPTKIISGLQAMDRALNLLEGLLALAKPLNKDELCEFLRVKRGTLEYYNGQGLPRFKIGNEVRYYLPDVLNFLKGRWENPGQEQYAYETEA